MTVNYDREEDILTLELDVQARINHAEQSGSIIVHLSPDDRPVLLEILRASEFLSGLVKAAARAEPVTI
jgi:uncharacterized protein YuzE